MTTILLVCALVMFALATFGYASNKINFAAAGLFLWLLTQVLPLLH
jgi:hypothetical protein